MSRSSEQHLLNDHGSRQASEWDEKIKRLNEQLKDANYQAGFHGDSLIGDKFRPQVKWWSDLRSILTFQNASAIKTVLVNYIKTKTLDKKTNLAQLIGSLSNDSILRGKFIEKEVKAKYERMLHPPVTYLGDAFKYRTADGKFNSAMHPQLGQAGAPYAKTVPSKTHPLGALPDPADLFDRLMAREEPGDDRKGRPSSSGLSSMLIYHATIIIHDIFRTNDTDKNISDSSSYLDLSPLYGFTEEMQRKIRDDKYKMGLLKPDTFAEDRLLRQPPGVCIYLVMYNRYHNYVATQLRRINENGRFSVPDKYLLAPLASACKEFVKSRTVEFDQVIDEYHNEWKSRKSGGLDVIDPNSEFADKTDYLRQVILTSIEEGLHKQSEDQKSLCTEVTGQGHESVGDKRLRGIDPERILEEFLKAHDAAWDKLDEDLFQTARLITCGMYIQISIHDYLRALMGFHNYDTNFTLDPRVEMKDHQNVSRGLGNQVTVEFNLLYRFHCAISMKDEEYAEAFMRELFEKDEKWDPKQLNLPQFMGEMHNSQAKSKLKHPREPWQQEFGLAKEGHSKFKPFKRNEFTGLFDDQAMVDELTNAMDDPIANFGPFNVPRCLRAVEILGIMQARKWEIGTLNDFREFFGMKRHATFDSITRNEKVQNALRDLYEHPDKVELYPGIFCETNEDNDKLNADPGPSDLDSALWAAIFSDAITLVRSDRFYTVDWNTNSLTNWGMKEVTPDSDVLKSSMFHRLLQRAFPEWYPYDSLRFFHPFYTSDKNATLAKQQGYDKEFSMRTIPLKRAENNDRGEITRFKYDIEKSNPQRPSKTLYLTNREDIKLILKDKSDILVHPARTRISFLPIVIHDVLKPGQNNPTHNGRITSLQTSTIEHSQEYHAHIMSYLVDVARGIINREVVTMEKGIYQLDIIRDFAIPIVTRYVADFLGFGHLLQSDANSQAPYSENEVYQHINNCQVFLSYNTDETKLLKRRKDFQNSINFLLRLTEEGNIREAGRWRTTRLVRHIFGSIASLGRDKPNYMTALGFRVAGEILKKENNTDKAAAIFLLTGLDSAYNVVLAFSSVMEAFFQGLYAKSPAKREQENKDMWLEIQQLAFKDDTESNERIRALVLKAQRWSVKLPIIRKASRDIMIKVYNTKTKVSDDVKVRAGQIVVCDINGAEQENTATTADEREELNYCSSFAEAFSEYHPKHVAATSLVTMVKVLAQLQNLRRGHDTQGVSKKISVDASHVGYANYMAPMRLQEIKRKIEKAKENRGYSNDEIDDIFPSSIRKPATATYLTPEWDEMVPFPTTWKLRFDGYGVSDYSKNGGEVFNVFKVPDDILPFYQPNGPSHIGGSFATPVCVCLDSWRKTSGKDAKDAKVTSDEVLSACGHVHAPQPATSGCKVG